MGVRGTENYIYYTDRRLGSGATGVVYFGRHKRRGDECAIKIYSRCRGHPQGHNVTNNELEWMRRLRHKNIVSLLSIESDLRTKDVALVMEYCSSGSLDRLLKQPSNLNGLPEEEFLNFFFQFCDGLHYLRLYAITHRDLKPSNILCTKTEYGSLWYKITDFGATKELFSEAQAIFGTEEYLHPDSFKCIILDKKKVPPELEVRSELWSIGVTIYEVATGKLPFVVPGGRNDKLKMYELISKKKKGDISGTIKDAKKAAEYSNCLPQTCWLSKSLAEYLKPILAGLIEVDHDSQMLFDDLFPTINNLRSMKEFKIFDVSSLMISRVYFSECTKFSDFKEEVSKLTGVKGSQQFYMVRRKRLEVDDDDFFYETRSEIKDEILILLPLEMKLTSFKRANISSCENLLSPNLAMDDYLWALHSSGWCSQICIHIGDLTMKQVLLSDLANKIINILETINFKVSWLSQALKSSELKLSCKFISPHVLKFQKKFDTKLSLTPFDPVCLSEKCSTKAESIGHFINNVRLEFYENRLKTLNHNEEQIHKYKRAQAEEKLRELQLLSRNHCEKQTEVMYEKFKQWYIHNPMKLLESYQQIETSLKDNLRLNEEDSVLKAMERSDKMIDTLECLIKSRSAAINRLIPL